MRSELIFATVLVASAITAGQQRKELPTFASTRLLLSAEVAQPNIKIGQPIWIKVKARNVSTSTVSIISGLGYELTVTDSSGNEVQRTEIGKRAVEAPLIKTEEIKIAPGGEIQHAVEVTREYEITRPGIYYARLAHYVVRSTEAAGQGAEKALSNPVQFTVSP